MDKKTTKQIVDELKSLRHRYNMASSLESEIKADAKVCDLNNITWVRADEVAKRIDKIVTYKMKEELLQELGGDSG